MEIQPATVTKQKEYKPFVQHKQKVKMLFGTPAWKRQEVTNEDVC